MPSRIVAPKIIQYSLTRPDQIVNIFLVGLILRLTEFTESKRQNAFFIQDCKKSRRCDSESSVRGLYKPQCCINNTEKDNSVVPAYVLGIKQNRRLLQGHIEVMNWNDFIMEELALKVG